MHSEPPAHDRAVLPVRLLRGSKDGRTGELHAEGGNVRGRTGWGGEAWRERQCLFGVLASLEFFLKSIMVNFVRRRKCVRKSTLFGRPLAASVALVRPVLRGSYQAPWCIARRRTPSIVPQSRFTLDPHIRLMECGRIAFYAMARGRVHCCVYDATRGRTHRHVSTLGVCMAIAEGLRVSEPKSFLPSHRMGSKLLHRCIRRVGPRSLAVRGFSPSFMSLCDLGLVLAYRHCLPNAASRRMRRAHYRVTT
ncbi:hypothetical protein B0H12DRAFT_314171 [Mycena haematopus]|nr:hypothetical protein B0H12DRAFT_314171 [Mycena haematopus]